MKVNKSQALMHILSVLIKNGYVDKNDIISRLEINDLTYRRYIQEIRAFLINFDQPYELIYNKREDRYELIKN